MIQRYKQEETDDNVDIFMNPHLYAIDSLLTDINNTQDIELKNKLIDDLTVVFLKDDILENPHVQSKAVKLLDLLRVDGTYHAACILLSDIVRHRPYVQYMFYKEDVFDMLNYSFYNTTIAFVFSMCYENKDMTQIWLDKYYKDERDSGNELVALLQRN